MSAHMVSPTHIDALLTAGLAWTDLGSLRWYDQPMPKETYQEGQPWGDGFVEWATQHARELTPETAGRVGAMLLAENRRSVDHRYAEAGWEEPYLLTRLPGTPDPVTVLRALDCYEYQSCEHPTWRHSEARMFCEALSARAINRLTRHDTTWHITNPRVFLPPARR